MLTTVEEQSHVVVPGFVKHSYFPIPRVIGEKGPPMVNKSNFQKEISMNPTTLYAHPFFTINLSRNFEIEPDELRTFVSGMSNWKYVEVEGIDTDGNEVDVMFLWSRSNRVAPLYEDQAFELAEWLDRVGFDINPDDIVPVNYYQAFACECNNYAPILPLKGMSRIEGIYGNIDNPNLYIQKAMRRATCA